MDAATRFNTEIVGALPVISNYLERLELGHIIDELVPWEGEVPLGTLVEILVTNRLLNPKALFRIDAWATRLAWTPTTTWRQGSSTMIAWDEPWNDW
jgi:hypothetical protein